MEEKSKNQESVRAWYDRTTKGARKALAGATLITLVAAVSFWALASHDLSARLQVFNGAITIPAAGGIWIAAFMFIWLIPMRELSFRSQESIDRTESRFREALDGEIKPTLGAWKRIAERVEREILPRFSETLKEMKETSSRLSEAASKAEKVADSAKPAIESLKKAADRLDRELSGGVLEEIRETLVSMRGLPPESVTRPNFERALMAVRKKTRENGNQERNPE